jgi:integrase
MATFRKRNGKWQARIQVSGGPTQARTFYKLSDARKWAQQIEEAYQQGLIETRPDPITLYEAFQRYLKDINPRKKRPHIERYRIKAWMQHSLSQRKLEYIRTYHLATWRDDKIKQGFQANTIRLHLAVLSHLYTVAQSEWGYEHLQNPVLHLTRPKLPRVRETRISDHDIDLLIQNTKSSYLPCLIKLALYTGMRRSELIKLKWSEINWDKQWIHLKDTKNGEDRFVPLTNNIKDVLRDINRSGDQLFPISEHAVTVAFRRAIKKSNLNNLSFHTLRHEAITRFFEMGLTIPEVACISGHKSWSMLKRYTHMNTKNLVARIDKSQPEDKIYLTHNSSGFVTPQS